MIMKVVGNSKLLPVLPLPFKVTKTKHVFQIYIP